MHGAGSEVLEIHHVGAALGFGQLARVLVQAVVEGLVRSLRGAVVGEILEIPGQVARSLDSGFLGALDDRLDRLLAFAL